MSNKQKSLNIIYEADKEGQVPLVLNGGAAPVHYSAIQNWVLCFLTDKGTRRANLEYGTTFGIDLRNGHLGTRAKVHESFETANTACLKYCTKTPTKGYVTLSNVILTDLRIDYFNDNTGYLILYLDFAFSDGFKQSTFIEVN